MIHVDEISWRETLQPLLYRSMKLLTANLRKTNSIYDEIYHYVRWPPGPALLLKSSHVPIDGLLTVACYANCKESVMIVLNDNRCCIGKKDLFAVSSHPDPTIGTLIVNALLERRRRLQNLALEYLPKIVTHQLNIRPDTLLNVHAYETYNLLCAVSADLDIPLERESWSVLDCFGFNLQLADVLYEAGFRDVNYIDGAGDNCLSKLREYPYRFHDTIEHYLQTVIWFINKGADFHHRSWDGEVLHNLGSTIGSKLGLLVTSVGCERSKFHQNIQYLSNDSIALLKMILHDDNSDACECVCSLNGCYPLTALLTKFSCECDIHDIRICCQLLADFLAVVLGGYYETPTEHDRKHFSATVLRFVTFWSLGLTHTCLHYNDPGSRNIQIQTEEIEEIQDEERLTIMELEGLLEKFLVELEVLKLDLSSFIIGPWQTYMDSLLSSSRPQSAEEIHKILEIGVVIDDSVDE